MENVDNPWKQGDGSQSITVLGTSTEWYGYMSKNKSRSGGWRGKNEGAPRKMKVRRAARGTGGAALTSDHFLQTAADGPGGLNAGGAGLGQTAGDAGAVAGGKEAGQGGLQLLGQL